MTPGMPGPLLRLKSGTESATPSVNGTISRNLVRMAALLGDGGYETLARQTCTSFAVEILQHPFLFVGLLDTVVALEMKVRVVTGVLVTDEVSHPAGSLSDEQSGGKEITPDKLPVSAWEQVTSSVREQTGLAASTSAAVAALVDLRSSNKGETSWLRSRNTLFRELGASGRQRNYLFVCEARLCRTIDV